MTFVFCQKIFKEFLWDKVEKIGKYSRKQWVRKNYRKYEFGKTIDWIEKRLTLERNCRGGLLANLIQRELSTYMLYVLLTKHKDNLQQQVK